jgi:Domain of unknown function (DUF222)/HNH endonuclease
MFDCDERVLRVAAAVDELVAEEFDAAAAPPQRDVLLALLEQRDRIDAEIVRRVGVFDRDGDWALEGALTPASWLRSRARLDGAEAAELVRTARLARDHAPTGEALRRGVVRTRRVHQIAYAVKDRREAYDENPDLLLEPAAALPGDQFRTVMKHWREAADDALAHDEAFAQYERRHLHASATLGGMVRTDGLLDPEGGEVVLAALEAAEEPDSPDDPAPPRTSAQRRADALVAIARAYLALESPEGRPRVTLDAVMTVPFPGTGPATDLGSLRHELEHVGPVPRWTVERLACDCSVGRVLMKGESEVLDLGRRVRLVSKAQRRALVHRDRHCAFPGCRRPPRRCDAHHIVTWLEGGATDLDNLVLLCRRHHVLCHEGGWRLTRLPDGTIEATPPDGGPPKPRGPDLTLVA